MSAGSAKAARSASQQRGGGAIPTSALHQLLLAPIAHNLAKELIVKHHYLGTMPGGTNLCFGIFAANLLVGALTIGVGPANAYNLVRGAKQKDCATLTRFWLKDGLPNNSASRIIGILLRALKKHTDIKYLLSYADPAQGHAGTIYQASGWLYTGLSEAMPLYDIGDGKLRHSRTLSHVFGTHSTKYFERRGVELRKVPQMAKHRYVYFLDRTLVDRLTVPVLPYPNHTNT